MKADGELDRWDRIALNRARKNRKEEEDEVDMTEGYKEYCDRMNREAEERKRKETLTKEDHV